MLDRDQAVASCEHQDQLLAGAWDDAVRSAGREAFVATERPYAEATWNAVARDLDAFAHAWTGLRESACRAAQAGDSERPEIGIATMACLDQQLIRLREVATVLTSADDVIVEHAIQTTAGLPRPDACVDARSTGGDVLDPDAAAKLTEVERLLYRAEALRDAGKFHDGLESAEAALERAIDMQHLRGQARANIALGQLRMETSDFDGAREAFHDALLAAEPADDAELVIRSRAHLVGALRQVPELDEAFRVAKQAQALLESRGGDDDLRALVLHQRGLLELTAGEFDRGIETMREALAVLERGREPEGGLELASSRALQVARLHLSIGNGHLRAGRFGAAREHYQRTFEVRRGLLGEEHPRVGAALNSLANVEQETGRYANALDGYTRVLAIYRRAYRPGSVHIGHVMNNLGLSLSQLGRNDEALERYREGEKIYRVALGDSSERLARLLANKALLLCDLDRHEEAVAAARESAEMTTEQMGPDHPWLNLPLTAMGTALLGLGRPQEASTELRRAIAVVENKLGGSHAHIAYPLHRLGLAQMELGQLDQARESLERSIEILTRKARDPVLLGSAKFALAKVIHATQPDRGPILAREAAEILTAVGGHDAEVAEIRAWLVKPRAPGRR